MWHGKNLEIFIFLVGRRVCHQFTSVHCDQIDSYCLPVKWHNPLRLQRYAVKQFNAPVIYRVYRNNELLNREARAGCQEPGKIQRFLNGTRRTPTFHAQGNTEFVLNRAKFGIKWESGAAKSVATHTTIGELLPRLNLSHISGEGVKVFERCRQVTLAQPSFIRGYGSTTRKLFVP